MRGGEVEHLSHQHLHRGGDARLDVTRERESPSACRGSARPRWRTPRRRSRRCGSWSAGEEEKKATAV